MNTTIRIEGPTVRGTFFITDEDRLVWDGKVWRGFGAPKDYMQFREAWIEASRLIKKQQRKCG